MRRTAMLVLLSFFSFAALAQTGYWQQQVDYSIAVSLNDQEHELNGTVKMNYVNNSPDTLFYIWIHLWPNAYKNDRTAFSDQLLENGNTQFYFSENESRGYINRLQFKVNQSIAVMEDHPQHQDIIRLLLPSPLPPGSHCTIETPFHVKLPQNISRGGHINQSYQVTQWYPKAAVYDRKGWHPIPYLDQGEFYSDFGDYEVTISLPSEYKVAATGSLKESKPTTGNMGYTSYTYSQQNIIDYAWFADKSFIEKSDTLQLPSGKIIKVAAYSLPVKKDNPWEDALRYIKKTILHRSALIGEYPYNTAIAVEAPLKFEIGMEYPTITMISGIYDKAGLESVIEHEVGHNWFYAILATNERRHPWMDEGMNTYYDSRYTKEAALVAPTPKKGSSFFTSRMPDNLNEWLFRTVAEKHTDQPVETSSGNFTAMNYGLSAYHKAGMFMQYLESIIGKSTFDSCMKRYFTYWKFKHPYPEDFQKLMEDVSGKNLADAFALLNKKGPLPTVQTTSNATGRPLKIGTFFNLKHTDQYKYLLLAPAVGYNKYDQLMVGLAFHNYTLPAEKLQFFVSPLYGTASGQLNGIGTVNYHWYPNKLAQKIEVGFNGARFSANHSLDTTGAKITERFFRAVPFVRVHLKHPVRSTLSSFIDFRTIIIKETLFDEFGFKAGSDSIFTYPKAFTSNTRIINQLSFLIRNTRVLYPYTGQLQLQQGSGFYRINATADYFFNYPKGGGMQVRLFAAKFGLLGTGSSSAFQYQPKLLAGNGADDYTNSNYFLGRSASTAFGDIPVSNGGIAAQQIMIQNTGGLKLRLDPYGSVQGYSENWVAAVNFNTTIPDKLLSMFPVKLPVRLFFDAGSYAEAWGKNPTTPKFLYTGGLQLSLLKNVLNVYVPLIYSSIFKEQLKTDPGANKFMRKITFSIDLQQLSLKKLNPSASL